MKRYKFGYYFFIVLTVLNFFSTFYNMYTFDFIWVLNSLACAFCLLAAMDMREDMKNSQKENVNNETT